MAGINNEQQQVENLYGAGAEAFYAPDASDVDDSEDENDIMDVDDNTTADNTTVTQGEDDDGTEDDNTTVIQGADDDNVEEPQAIAGAEDDDEDEDEDMEDGSSFDDSSADFDLRAGLMILSWPTGVARPRTARSANEVTAAATLVSLSTANADAAATAAVNVPAQTDNNNVAAAAAAIVTAVPAAPNVHTLPTIATAVPAAGAAVVGPRLAPAGHGAPPGALHPDEHFVLGQPRPIGVLEANGPGGHQMRWVTRATRGNPIAMDWNDAEHIHDLNRWRQQRRRRANVFWGVVNLLRPPTTGSNVNRRL